jgi:hypothetical protein
MFGYLFFIMLSLGRVIDEQTKFENWVVHLIPSPTYPMFGFCQAKAQLEDELVLFSL